MKINFPIFFIILFAFMSCIKEDDNINDSVNNSDTNKTTVDIPDNAPINIVGKALILYNSKMQYTLQASGFTSNNACNVVMIGGVYKLVGTPSYTYSKSSSINATVVVNYNDQYKVGSDYTNSNRTYTAVLSFTSKTGGSFTGSEKTVCKSSISGLNGTTSRSISGTFTLN